MALQAKKILKLQSPLNRNQLSPAVDVLKGHMAISAGENKKKRYVVPVSYLNNPSFQEMLSRAKEEFGFEHPMGGLTIPYRHNRQR
ncbi:hypothetical protein GIB67_007549 [Kingdonia uniflora]|uniref:Small auxin up regulated protein n=1 Tax=Kingdonia uniflora TaxID=39325 RepID=A0A7J7LNG1_9MAGN|nr:hypothetical protein GIB67_007549 [Kingdonia uniflora]